MWFRDRKSADVAARVLMVCTGNICRSPTAQAVLRKKLADAGLARLVMVDSAGTQGTHVGEPPDARAQRHARSRGYDLSGLRARKVTAEDLQRFDYVLAADESHLQRLRMLGPTRFDTRLALLLDFASPAAVGRELPDPYYGPAAGFEQVLDLVEAACDGLVARLAVDLGAQGNLPGKA